MKPLDQLDNDEFEALARRAAALPEPPRAVVQAAIALWPKAADNALASAVQALGKRIIAALAFDSWATTPALAGVRSGFAQTRHLLFTADDRDVDLRIAPSEGAFALTGQILGPGRGIRVELAPQADDITPAAPMHVALVDDLGEFRLDGVARGTYRLSLQFGDDRIDLPPIDIGGR